jgi:hypothetical protein
MRKPNNLPNCNKEAVLAELVEGRHPGCQTIVARFLRSQEWKEASVILREAIQADSSHRTGSVICAPPGWLLPI